MQSPGTLELVDTMSGLRYALHGRPLRGGDLIAMCFSGGWVVGQYNWNSDPAERPRFHCSIELAGGAVETLALEIPEKALLQRRESGPIL